MSQANKNVVLVTPKIIQTGKINYNKLNKSFKFSEMVTLSAVNKSHQDINEQRNSLKRIGSKFGTDSKLRSSELIIPTNYGMLTVYVFTTHTEEEQIKHLRRCLRDIYEKQNTNTNFTDFHYDAKGYFDFWWDIENDIMWSLNKDFMEQFLPNALFNSYCVMEPTFISSLFNNDLELSPA